MRRRDFLKVTARSATPWPLAAHAQQAAMPSVGFVSGRSAEAVAHLGGAFHKGLNETGYAEGQNVMVEYHWLEANTIKVIPLYPS
jgi:putative ABC transport system substrate-binding protein